MVICLLLAVAVVLWPLRSHRMTLRGRGVPRGQSPGSDHHGPRELRSWTDRRTTAGPQRVLLLVGMAGVGGLAFVVAGVAGLIAAAAAAATGAVLVGRALADRRGRVALLEINAGLRMLGRELRAGAEPAVAATNACTAARGAGADVLRGLARLTRADDRSAAGSRANADAPFLPTSSAVGVTTESSAAGTAGAHQEDPRTQVAARLRSGWLLTRRHGLAFTPLIDALAADLAEQIAAEAERAGQVAGPRMSGYVMAVLPLMGLALGVGMGADPFRILLLTPLGNILLLVGVLLTCAGLLWSARIVRR